MAPIKETAATVLGVKREGKTDDQKDTKEIGRRNQPRRTFIDLSSDGENGEGTNGRKTSETPGSDSVLHNMNPQSIDMLRQQLTQANQKIHRLMVRDQQLNQALTRSNQACQQLSRERQRLTQQKQYLSSRALQLDQELKRVQSAAGDKDKVEIGRLKGEIQQLKVESQQLKEDNLILAEKNQRGKEDYQKLADREAELVGAMRRKFGVPQSTLTRMNEITQELERNKAESEQRHRVLRAKAAQAAEEFERNCEVNREQFILDFGQSLTRSFQQ